jgi:hypothetical protein
MRENAHETLVYAARLGKSCPYCRICRPLATQDDSHFLPLNDRNFDRLFQEMRTIEDASLRQMAINGPWAAFTPPLTQTARSMATTRQLQPLSNNLADGP